MRSSSGSPGRRRARGRKRCRRRRFSLRPPRPRSRLPRTRSLRSRLAPCRRASSCRTGLRWPSRRGSGEPVNFNPNDLYGILPALILSLGALVLLTSEVFLRATAGEQPDRRYQAWLAAAVAAAGLWAALAQLGDPTLSLFSGAAVSDGFARLVAAVVCATMLLS